MLVCALEGEIAVAEMSLLGAVAVGEDDADGLSVHRSEVDAYRIPVTPEYIAHLMLPARKVARDETTMIAAADAVAIDVGNVEFKLGLVRRHMAGVLFDQRIA